MRVWFQQWWVSQVPGQGGIPALDRTECTPADQYSYTGPHTPSPMPLQEDPALGNWRDLSERGAALVTETSLG